MAKFSRLVLPRVLFCRLETRPLTVRVSDGARAFEFTYKFIVELLYSELFLLLCTALELIRNELQVNFGAVFGRLRLVEGECALANQLLPLVAFFAKQR